MIYPKLPVTEDRRKKLTPAQIEDIKKMRDEGMSLRAIGKIFNVSKTTIKYHCSSQDEKDKLNEQRYKLIKEQEEQDPEFKEKRHKEKLKNHTELLARSEEKRKYKSKSTYKWKKKKYAKDVEFREKTRRQAREGYHRKRGTSDV